MSVLFSPSYIFDHQDHELEAANSKVVTLDQILKKDKVKILIVSGHDDEYWGTQFEDTKEVELNREMAQHLYSNLSKDKNFVVTQVSDKNGYTSIFKKYFKNEKIKINLFIKKSKNKFSNKIQKNNIEQVEEGLHNLAPSEAAFRLYAINKWVNENKYDLVIHVHMNDYGNRQKNSVGTEKGFVIFTPSKTFQNYDLSRKLSDSVFDELKKVQTVSSFFAEREGVVEDNGLIALGSNDTLTAGSILIEYGYIYEDVINNPLKRDTTFDMFAEATHQGLKDLLKN